MRALLLLFFMLPVSFNISAIEPVDEQQLMLYYEIPLGDTNSRENKHQFGLRLDHTSHEPGTDVHISSLYRKTAALDFRMGYDGVQSIKVHGVDYAAYLIAKAAAGEEAPVEPVTETPAEPAPAATETSPEEGQPVSESAPADTATTETEEAPKEEKGVVQQKLDELPFGVVIGVILGIGIIAGVGG